MRTAFAVLALFAGGCGEARPVAEPCPSWRDEVGPLLEARCAGCHGGPHPAGGLSVATYLNVVGDGASGAARLGDPDSPLLRVLDPADPTHAGVADAAALLRRWVVSCRLDYFHSAFHPPGLLDRADREQFHGALAREVGYDLSVCASCHGADFAGAPATPSCLGCHPQKPTACTTCHGAPPPTGSHLAHAAPAASRPVDCSECHVKPMVYSDAGHLLADDGKVKTAARVTFGPLAGQGAAPSQTDGACAVYCHGASRPVWGGQAPCGSCHGAPPAGHASDRCGDCHPREPALHVDGKLMLGDGSGTCSACHGTPGNPAPPTGAHAAHLTATHKLRGPIACAECHSVPDQVGSPGHLDSPPPAEVFPGPGGLASSDGAKASWDHAAGRCADVYCHGGGQKLAADQAPGIDRTPDWTATGSARCGGCHGVPPSDGQHDPALRLADCARCHAKTVDAFGAIRVPGSHIDGVIDVQ
jgi:predicted CxxxxCH...CXXCH cytochrome family protein